MDLLSSARSPGDIRIDQITVPSSGVPGGSISTKIRLQSSSSGTVKNVYTTWYLSNDTQFSPNDRYIGQQRFDTLSGGFSNGTKNLSLPSAIPEEWHYLYALVDPL